MADMKKVDDDLIIINLYLGTIGISPQPILFLHCSNQLAFTRRQTTFLKIVNHDSVFYHVGKLERFKIGLVQNTQTDVYDYDRCLK